jgi:hypothetical protein
MTTAASVNLQDLLTAFEWVSGSGTFDNAAYVSRVTGAVHLSSSGGELDEELPADIDDERLYLVVPSRSDLDLGRHLVLRFVDANMPDAHGQVRAIFSKPGAYSRYKDLLERHGQLDAWYQFEERSVEQALRDWCAENDLLVTK